MISWQRGKTAPLGVFAMAESLSCASHVKNLSRHKDLQNEVVVATALRLFITEPATDEQRNLHLSEEGSTWQMALSFALPTYCVL